MSSAGAAGGSKVEGGAAACGGILGQIGKSGLSGDSGGGNASGP